MKSAGFVGVFCNQMHAMKVAISIGSKSPEVAQVRTVRPSIDQIEQTKNCCPISFLFPCEQLSQCQRSLTREVVIRAGVFASNDICIHESR